MTTACCNGQPSPFLQDQIHLVTTACSTNPCKHFHQSSGKGGVCLSSVERSSRHRSPTKERIHDINRDLDFSFGRKTSIVRRILAIAILCLFTVLISVILSCLVLRRLHLCQGSEAVSRPDDGQPLMTKSCVQCRPETELMREESGSESAEKVFCCSSDEAKMQQLIIEGVRLSLQDRLKGEELYTLLNNRLIPSPINKDAVHVFFRPKRRPKRPKVDLDQPEDENFEILRDWSSDGDSAFIRSGIEFNSSRGHFRVKDAGIYVIYSRIVYENDNTIYDKSTGDVITDRTRLTFGHSIDLYHRHQYRRLLDDEQTMQCDLNTVCYNSRVFSTIHLTKDSQIAVRVMQSRFVSLRSRASYFGLYKID